ncbi:MAG: PEP-CTERM sorting domain-containing protein [Phycisphaerales bacterium]
MACVVLLTIQAGAEAQLLDLRTLDSASTSWTGYDAANFQPYWKGDTQYVSLPLWNGGDFPPPGGGGIQIGGGTGGDGSGGSGGSGSTIIIGYPPYSGWTPPAIPDIRKPEIFRRHIQSVEQIGDQRSLATHTTAEASGVVAAYGRTANDSAEFSHYARVVGGGWWGNVTIADGRAIAHLDATTGQMSFTASGKVGAEAGAQAQAGSYAMPPHSSAAGSATLVSQATFELKAVTQFDLSTALAQYGQMGLNVSISREGQTQPLVSWAAQEGQQVSQQVYGVLDAGRYTITVQGGAQAGAEAAAVAAPVVVIPDPIVSGEDSGDGALLNSGLVSLVGPVIPTPLSDPVSQFQSRAGEFDVRFGLNGLEYWYYTTTEDGSGRRLLADSPITIEVPEVKSGWVFIRGLAPSTVPAAQLIYSEDQLPADLLDTVERQRIVVVGPSQYEYPIGWLQYVDAYWTGEWSSVDRPLADVYGDELDPTGWYDFSRGRWINSPLDALRFDLPTGLNEATYLTQIQSLTVPEPTSLAVLMTMGGIVVGMSKRKRGGENGGSQRRS